jgi:ABC-2 type transport system ATP-binding protein
MFLHHHLHLNQPGTARTNRAVLGRWASPIRTPDGQHKSGKSLLRYSAGYKKLSPMENLLYGARLYGMESKNTRKQVVEILTRLGLEKRSIYSPMEEMSRGMQQKVAIARALLSHPQLLLLDEPTTGLDPRSKREVQAVIRELREEHNTTILLTTHDMNEAEMLCDRIAIMDSGTVIALDTPTALKNRIPVTGEKETTLEDVFLELTGKKLGTPEEESQP